jgi:hypothetical protein
MSFSPGDLRMMLTNRALPQGWEWCREAEMADAEKVEMPDGSIGRLWYAVYVGEASGDTKAAILEAASKHRGKR